MRRPAKPAAAQEEYILGAAKPPRTPTKLEGIKRIWYHKAARQAPVTKTTGCGPAGLACARISIRIGATLLIVLE